MIAPEAGLPVSRQCALLGIARSSFYYRPRPEAAEELDTLKRLDRIFTDYPVYGSRKRHPEHKVYPSLLRGKTIDQPNQVCGQLT